MFLLFQAWKLKKSRRLLIKLKVRLLSARLTRVKINNLRFKVALVLGNKCFSIFKAFQMKRTQIIFTKIILVDSFFQNLKCFFFHKLVTICYARTFSFPPSKFPENNCKMFFLLKLVINAFQVECYFQATYIKLTSLSYRINLTSTVSVTTNLFKFLFQF